MGTVEFRHSSYIQVGQLQVAEVLYNFIEHEVLPPIGLTGAHFWQHFEAIAHELTPINQALLATRNELQIKLDAWHQKNPGPITDIAKYQAFLKEIGYLAEASEHVQIETSDVDEEIAHQAGPQLVVPILNARYALNAANARWGSLYDALYGTDAIPEDEGANRTDSFNPVRGAKVVAWGAAFLDQHFPLKNGASHADVAGYSIEQSRLLVLLKNGTPTELVNDAAFVGFQGEPIHPSSVLLIHHGLHVHLSIDRNHPIGSQHPAGLADIVLESAISTILDLEDSIAAVDATDKVLAYRNWLGIVLGSLTETLHKNGKTITRTLNPDRIYVSKEGKPLVLHGRSLMFIRNVGHLMTSQAVLLANGDPIPEGILDAIVTTTIALVDIKRLGKPGFLNTRTGSVYIVKPKMHGPDEVAFADALFARVEAMLGLSKGTVKLGIMDEERRTSVNLKACIAAAKNRVAFINTGFLDRTGDEIHTAMHAGPVLRKADMKNAEWLKAYEAQNVRIGLECGLKGKAQIGKGMWAMPDLMHAMLQQKIAHPKAGANTAWVPSPTAATLHATHYHAVDVREVQEALLKQPAVANETAMMQALLTIPVCTNSWTPTEIQAELDNNVQGLLGYVVRWVAMGIGCSKVPDIHHVGLMEDRATLRISSQHIANWLLHGVVTELQVRETLNKMAAVVDEQNASDPDYVPMSPNLTQSAAFQAARDLIFKGVEQPSGYTEPLLHAWRLHVKGQGLEGV